MTRPVGRQMVVLRQGFGDPGAVGDLEHGGEPVGGGLVRAEQAEIPIVPS